MCKKLKLLKVEPRVYVETKIVYRLNDKKD